ncbi:hypothetical protein MML48_4g00008954 [Holotrichia oblita]|uniref:Uncharacterized protein n=1 Tax=Holotrichia oblita TaxID=644536 RepID=A0ACB9TA52_HOLOL|nr:hypothetical protein MML48_4g00008954 [Holotrichia oblita]
MYCNYRSVADQFDVSISTAWEYFHKVINLLVKHREEYIKWPKSYLEFETITNGFQKRAGIAGIIGAIDGTHIPITQPHLMPNPYINRHKYHSIVLQGVCTANYMFIDCFAGCPGSIHDARVFRMSPLNTAMNNNLISDKHHMLGDSAYPNQVNLITPYKDNGHLSRKQKKFNYLHSAARVCTEQTFGLLKGRFRILRHVNIYCTDVIPKVIIACCILHNICMTMNDNDVFFFFLMCGGCLVAVTP